MEEMNLTVKLVLILTPIVSALLFSSYYHFKVIGPRVSLNYQNFLRTRKRIRIMTLLMSIIGWTVGLLIDGFILGKFDTFLGFTNRVM